jgi:flagellar hook protein FlgE
MSFNIALTGLNAVNEQLNAVSNNIANSGTTGFKSSRAEFGSIYSDTMAMGVETIGLTQSISQGGSLVTTGRSLDLAISGGGFFVTKSNSGDTSYTRAGIFGTDKNNNLTSATGQLLQGYPVDANNVLQVGTVSNLKLSNANIAAQATDSLDFVFNLDAANDIPTLAPFDPTKSDSFNSTYTTKIFDSQGKEHTLTQYFVKTGANTWNAHYYVDGNAAANKIGTPPPQELTFDTNGNMTSPYDYAGVLRNDPLTPPVHAPVNLAITAAQLGGGVADLNMEINYGSKANGGSTQFGSNFVVNNNQPTGHASGEQTGIAVEKDGKVYATYSNGERLLQGQVAMATFANLDGLKTISGTSWVETSDSGQALIGVPGVGAFGDLTAGALESSNVDLTQQLVELMEGQRNYQANTKVLSTDKELTQVLFNAI